MEEKDENNINEVFKRLESVNVIGSHMAQQMKLVIEDDTCLIRILNGLKTILKEEVASLFVYQVNNFFHICLF